MKTLLYSLLVASLNLASATAAITTAQSRSVAVSSEASSPTGNDPQSVEAASSDMLGIFDESLNSSAAHGGSSAEASSSQNSTISATGLSASIMGRADVALSVLVPTAAHAAYAQSDASLNLSFTIDEPYTFALTAFTTQTEPIGNESDVAYIWLRSLNGSGSDIALFGDAASGSGPTGPASGTISGVLPAGNYGLEARTLISSPFGFQSDPLFGSDSRSAAWELSFAVNPVPEPSSILLLLVSLGGYLGIRRRNV